MVTDIENGADLIDPAYVFEPGIVQAVKEFARSKPWRGDIDERKAKFQSALKSLALAAEIEEPQFEFADDVWSGNPSDGSFTDRRFGVITMTGRLSVVTFLHLFAALNGRSRLDCFRWSLNLFAKCFPISFGRCHFEGLFLRR